MPKQKYFSKSSGYQKQCDLGFFKIKNAALKTKGGASQHSQGIKMHTPNWFDQTTTVLSYNSFMHNLHTIRNITLLNRVLCKHWV